MKWIAARFTGACFASACLMAVSQAEAAPCMTVTVTGSQGGPQAYQLSLIHI